MTIFLPSSTTPTTSGTLAYAGLWSGGVADASGRPAPSTPVAVYPLGGTNFATLYQPPQIPPLLMSQAAIAPNPITTDFSGNLEIWTEPGIYILYIEGQPVQTISVPVDPNDVLANSGGAGGGTGGGSPTGQASGDLGGFYPSPVVVSTHLSSPLTPDKGGTGQTSLNAVSISAFAPPAGGFSMASQQINNLAAGTAATDAVNLAQLNAVTGSGGGGTPTGTAGGDLGGLYPNPQVVSTSLAAALPIAQGGTGANTLSGAQANLGITGTGTPQIYPLVPGADPTGGTDSTTAINNALSSGGSWGLTKGNYVISGSLNFSVAGSALVGAGQDTILTLSSSWSGTQVFNMTANNCLVRDMQITNAQTPIIIGAAITGAQFCNLTNIYFSGITGYAVTVTSSGSVVSTGTMLRDLKGSACGGGVHVVGNSSTNFFSQVFMSNIEFVGCTSFDGLRCENSWDVYGSNVRMSVAQTNAVGSPFHMISANDIYLANVNAYTENTSTGSPGQTPGILIESGAKITFSGGISYNNLVGLRGTGGTRITFVGMDFYANWQHGLDLSQPNLSDSHGNFNGTYKFVGGGARLNGGSTTSSTSFYDFNWTGAGVCQFDAFSFQSTIGTVSQTVKGSFNNAGTGQVYMSSCESNDDANVTKFTNGSAVTYTVTKTGVVSGTVQIAGAVQSNMYKQTSQAVAPSATASTYGSSYLFPVPDSIYNNAVTLRTSFTQNFDSSAATWVVTFPINFALNSGDTIVVAASIGNLTTMTGAGFGATWTTPVLTAGATPALAMVVGANCAANAPAVGGSLSLTLTPGVSSAGRVVVSVWSGLATTPVLSSNSTHQGGPGGTAPAAFTITATDTVAIPVGSLVIGAGNGIAINAWNPTTWSNGQPTTSLGSTTSTSTSIKTAAADYIITPSALTTISDTYSGTTDAVNSSANAGVIVFSAIGTAKFVSLLPLGCDFNVTNAGNSETITIQVTATFSDTTTQSFTASQLGSGRFSPTFANLRTLYKDNVTLAGISFQIQSSIASSTASATMDLWGANTY